MFVVVKYASTCSREEYSYLNRKVEDIRWWKKWILKERGKQDHNLSGTHSLGSFYPWQKHFLYMYIWIQYWYCDWSTFVKCHLVSLQCLFSVCDIISHVEITFFSLINGGLTCDFDIVDFDVCCCLVAYQAKFPWLSLGLLYTAFWLGEIWINRWNRHMMFIIRTQ